MLAEIRAGIRRLLDGSADVARGTQDSALVTADGHGRYGELAARGAMFSGGTGFAGTTIVAANVTPIGAAAATILSLYNPIGSGVDVELIRTLIAHISGTPGAGAWLYNFQFNQTLTAIQNCFGVAGGTPVPNRLGGNAGGKARVFTQTALTGSAAQLQHRAIGTTQFAAAIAATTQGLGFVDEVAGSIVIPPGGLLSIAAPVIGTTHIVAASFEWDEVLAQV